MRVYVFEYYSEDLGWLPYFMPTKESSIIDRGEFVKYAEDPSHVRPVFAIDFYGPADLCERLNALVDIFGEFPHEHQ